VKRYFFLLGTRTSVAVLRIVELSLVTDNGGNKMLGVVRVVGPVVARLKLDISFHLGVELFLLVAKRLTDFGRRGSRFGTRWTSSRTIHSLIDGDWSSVAGFGGDPSWVERSGAGRVYMVDLVRSRGISSSIVCTVGKRRTECGCNACKRNRCANDAHFQDDARGSN